MTVQALPSVPNVDNSIWNFSVGALAILFLIYITSKGELPSYISLLLYTPPTGTATAAPAASASTTAVANGNFSGAFGAVAKYFANPFSF